jgi:transcriptional regulator of acetoin/glycerol metabolism
MAILSCDGNEINLERVAPDEPGSCRETDRKVKFAPKTGRDQVAEAIEAADGNKKKAAALLGIHRSTVYRKLRFNSARGQASSAG